jgi:NADH-quinone oxidoreductase subunit G
LCTRCVRYTKEITKTHELVMFQRGDHNEIGLFPGKKLENAYSLNTVDICPVGALTSRDFRFKVRVWLLKSVPSVCAGCATGCNTVMQHHDNQVHRVLPRENKEINRYWLCDEGRLRYHPIHEGRFLKPRAEKQDTSWEDAIIKAASLLAGAKNLGVVLSPQGTNEDAYVAAEVAKQLNAKGLYIGGRAAGEADDFLRHADKNPNRAGVRAHAPQAGTIDDLLRDLAGKKLGGLLVIGHDVDGQDAKLAAALQIPVVALVESESAWTEKASVLLPICSWAEVDGSFTNYEGKVQKIRTVIRALGESEPTWRALVRLGQKLTLSIRYKNLKEIQVEMKGRAPELPTTVPAE